ncbi:MAG: lytic transglycosylase domain-containing protein, partial [Bacteroidales bacterium]|nr:lytic transglycosylase domain-containing protein [Bacteroidales bacterium]
MVFKSAALFRILIFGFVFFPICGLKSQQFKTKDSIPVFPDIVYEFRFARLHQNSAIDLEFNSQVKKYIEIFTIQRRNDISKILGLKDYYFPIFEEYLDKYGLPLELKYLPVIESGLNPLA